MQVFKEVPVNLGCPYYCEGFQCVDENPHDPRVIKLDCFAFLDSFAGLNLHSIRSKNLLEHLDNQGLFIEKCAKALKKGGVLVTITDNAEWFGFYFPIIKRFGIGAHAVNDYVIKNDSTCNSSRHYAVFTKLHMRNLLTKYGFEIISLKRICYGARLECVARKIA